MEKQLQVWAHLRDDFLDPQDLRSLPYEIQQEEGTYYFLFRYLVNQNAMASETVRLSFSQVHKITVSDRIKKDYVQKCNYF